MQKNLTMIVLAVSLAGCLGGERRLVDRTQHTLELGALDAADIERLRFDVGAGRLDIEGDADATTIEVTVELATNRSGTTEDDAAIDALEATLEAVDDEARLRVHLRDGPVGYYADVHVTLPSSLVVEGEDDSGDLCIHDVAGLTLRDQSGQIELRRIAGPVTIDDDSGDLVADGIDGALEITDASGQIVVDSVNGQVSVFDTSGDITVRGVAGGAHVEDDSGQIVLLEIAGDVTILDGSGDISVQTEGDVDVIEDGSGSVSRL